MRYWDDIKVGDRTVLGPRHVSAEEIVAFGRKYDTQPFHVDPEAAKTSQFGGLIASGWHTAAMLMRMFCDAGHSGGPVLASPGFDDLKWLKPVRPGDVLSARQTVKEVVPSRSRPDRGLVKFDSSVLNQKGETVMTAVTMVFVRRRANGA